MIPVNSTHVLIVVSALCVAGPSIATSKILYLASRPTKNDKAQGAWFVFRIIIISVKNAIYSSSLTEKEFIERKTFSNLADNAMVAICLECLSLVMVISSILILQSLPDETDYAIVISFCMSNMIIFVIQVINLNRGRRIHAGKEQLGLLNRGRNTYPESEKGENFDIANISAETLANLVISRDRRDNIFMERDRKRVIDAWTSSKYRALVELSDRDYEGSQNDKSK